MSNFILPPIVINATDWWLKPIAMLQHNWALLEETSNGAELFFWHDGGITLDFQCYKNGYRDVGIVVDSLKFESKADALEALKRNSFALEKELGLDLIGSRPKRPFFDGRAVEQGIYSKLGYWIE
jgi:hypothetical protein